MLHDQQKAIRTGGLSCSKCPFKDDLKAQGRKWGKKAIKEFCHHGKKPEKKGLRDGCAVLWPIWGVVVEYAETMALIDKGMPAPIYWMRGDWRNAVLVSNRMERLAAEDLSRKEN